MTGDAPGSDAEPVTLLIGALGGEGGGVLASWIVDAATARGLAVQSTSIPGVAQRTGATTYYLEICPVPLDRLGGREPVMALYPAPCRIDLMVASEILEAGRALELGYVSPDRTTLVASTHRVYSIAEKSAMADGRYDDARIGAAARELARRALLTDFAAAARQAGAPLNSVLLGAIAATAVLPLPAQAFEEAIERSGKAVDANRRGFRAGLAAAAAAEEPGRVEAGAETAPAPGGSGPALPGAFAPRLAGLAPAVREVAAAGVARLIDYQDPGYASLYLDRLAPVAALDEALGGADRGFALASECARHLALWMSYEDVVRVADLKSRPERLARVRAEVAAHGDEPVRVTEYFKPGLDEICAVLPPGPAARLRGWAAREPRRAGLQVPLRLRSDTVTGHLVLRALAGMRRWRPRSSRFLEEQALIEAWLDRVRRGAGIGYDLGLEIVECASLNKGYGDTFARGRERYRRILAEVVDPALAAGEAAAGAVRRAREAALADPRGRALAGVLVAPPARAGGQSSAT